MTARGRKLARRWLAFATEDLRVVPILIEEEAFGLACFHAQQAAEKALKAILTQKNATVPRVHQLGELIQYAVTIVPSLVKFEDSALMLDQFYVPTRYPDALPGTLARGLPKRADANRAYKAARGLVEAVEIFLGVEH